MPKHGTIRKIGRIVESACRKESNAFGYGAWTHHITKVVKYAKILGRKLGADLEILEISALLHDYASVTDKRLYPSHHIHGARIAGELLSELGYPEDKIRQVQECIYCHRGSRRIRRVSPEAKILASADAMAHFDSVHSLLYLAYVNKGMGIEDGARFVVAKLLRSYKKIIPKGRPIVRKKLLSALELLGKDTAK